MVGKEAGGGKIPSALKSHGEVVMTDKTNNIGHRAVPKGKRTDARLRGFAIWGRIALVAALVLGSSSSLFGDSRGSSKLSPEFAGLAPGTKVDVIIQFRSNPDDSDLKNATSKGGALKNRYRFFKGAAFARMPVAALKGLAQDSHVTYISLDRSVGKSLDHVAQAVNADIAWSYGFDGSGVGIAIVDSGVYNHPDFNSATTGTSRIIYNESFVPGDASTGDLYGHGTHVAGIAAGNGTSAPTHGYNATYKGIAPNANIINLRALDSTGAGTDSTVIAAIDRAIQLKNTYNVRILNLSLGRSVYESYRLDPLCQAVDQAWKAGIFVVVAAGNNGRDNSMHTRGYATINAPGNDPYVITVGAMNMNNSFSRSDDIIASYSSKGPTLVDHIAKPDLVAPGNRVVSLRDPGSTLDTNNPRFDVATCPSPSCGAASMYFRLSGTSMATPVVSGAAALMLQKDPTLTPDMVKARMMKTAYKGQPMYSTTADGSGITYSLQRDIFTYGAGYLDVAAALNSSDVAVGVAVSPSAVYDATTGCISLVYGDSVVWGTSVVWG